MSDELEQNVSIGTHENIIKFDDLAVLKRCAQDWLKMPSFRRADPYFTNQLELALRAIDKSEEERHSRARIAAEAIVNKAFNATPALKDGEQCPSKPQAK